LSFVTLLLMISTGALLAFILRPQSGPATVWGLTRHEWGDIHFYISIVFLVLMTVHLFLHLGFIKKAIAGQATQLQSYRLIIGVLSFLVLLALAFAPFLAPVENQLDSGSRHHRNEWRE